jgi:hypothetical protein
MDPVTAFTNLATELIKLVGILSESQPPEVRKQLWEWYVQDLAWWRKFLKIDTP